MSNEERIRICMEKRGYIVLASMRSFPIGHVIDNISGKSGGKTPQPFYITQETTIEDANEQSRLLGEDTDNTWAHFYRLSTD